MKRLGVQPNTGREKIFEVREVESDISFIRNYLSKDLAKREDLYLFQKKGNEYRITDKDYEMVRDQLVSMRVNGGFPYILVKNGDYLRNGELYLMHGYEGMELDPHYLENVLPYIYQLWGRPVHLETYVMVNRCYIPMMVLKTINVMFNKKLLSVECDNEQIEVFNSIPLFLLLNHCPLHGFHYD